MVSQMTRSNIYNKIARLFAKAAFELSGANFIFGQLPIANLNNFNHCISLKTSRVPFWHREKQVLISLSPLVPSQDVKICKVLACNTSKYNIKDVYGRYVNSESLTVLLTHQYLNKDKYSIQSVQYLPDTKKTLSSTISCFPNNGIDLESNWELRKQLHLDPTVEVFDHVALPNVWHRIKYLLACASVKTANMIYHKKLKDRNDKGYIL